MDIEKVRAAADIYSGKLSDLARQLSFAGIAVIWIFKIGGDTGGMVYPGELYIPLACFLFSLCFDLLHYAYSTIAWTLLGNCMDKKNQTGCDISNAINIPSEILFYLKVVLVLIGYAILLCNLGSEF